MVGKPETTLAEGGRPGWSIFGYHYPLLLVNFQLSQSFDSTVRIGTAVSQFFSLSIYLHIGTSFRSISLGLFVDKLAMA
jgi:hypothetical protein